jgi:hypothetical protein
MYLYLYHTNDNMHIHAYLICVSNKFEYIIHKYLSHYGCGEWVLKSTDLGKPIMKSIEISLQIAGGMRSG